MSKTINYKGQPCEVLATKGGWTTLQKENGTIVKVRNGELKAPKEAKAAKPKAAGTPKRGVYEGDASKLVKGKGVTAGGNPTLDKDDKAAKLLRGLTFKQAVEVVARAEAEAGEAESITAASEEMEKAYGKLNPGLQRMSLGNRLRGALNAQ